MSREDDEMAKALALDGEKLRQLTGEDHGPWELDDPIPQGDADLAAFMQAHKADEYLEFEDIVTNDWLGTSFNRDKLKIGRGERLVILACGHEVVTSNQHRMKCPFCRYLMMNGYDYDGFRHLGGLDPLAGYWDRIKVD